MRSELKVYMSHTDAMRVNAACARTGESLSGFMRRVALEAADAAGIPVYRDPDWQRPLPLEIADVRAAEDDARKGAR
jgi:hypothetical protein